MNSTPDAVAGYGASAPPVCPRHPDRISYVMCQRCGRPVCPECQRPAPVGIQCVDCVREEALRRMGDRAGVDQIRSFTTLLIQSNKLGSSIGQTLRVYASEMCERRKMLAQEKAHRLPVLLSIPLVACMLPVMIGVLMLPAAIRVVRQLLPMMAG